MARYALATTLLAALAGTALAQTPDVQGQWDIEYKVGGPFWLPPHLLAIPSSLLEEGGEGNRCPRCYVAALLLGLARRTSDTHPSATHACSSRYTPHKHRKPWHKGANRTGGSQPCHASSPSSLAPPPLLPVCVFVEMKGDLEYLITPKL